MGERGGHGDSRRGGCRVLVLLPAPLLAPLSAGRAVGGGAAVPVVGRIAHLPAAPFPRVIPAAFRSALPRAAALPDLRPSSAI